MYSKVEKIFISMEDFKSKTKNEDEDLILDIAPIWEDMCVRLENYNDSQIYRHETRYWNNNEKQSHSSKELAQYFNAKDIYPVIDFYWIDKFHTESLTNLKFKRQPNNELGECKVQIVGFELKF